MANKANPLSTRRAPLRLIVEDGDKRMHVVLRNVTVEWQNRFKEDGVGVSRQASASRGAPEVVGKTLCVQGVSDQGAQIRLNLDLSYGAR
jgi:hypothetical protein